MLNFYLAIPVLSLLTEACYSPRCAIQNPEHGYCRMRRRDIEKVKPYEYTGKLSIRDFNVTTNTQTNKRLGNIQLSIERGTKRHLRSLTIGIYEDSLSWKYLVKINSTKPFSGSRMKIHVSCLKISDQKVNMSILLGVKSPTRGKPMKNREVRRKYKLHPHTCLLVIFGKNRQRQPAVITVTTKEHDLCQRKRRLNRGNVRCICRKRGRRKSNRKLLKNTLTDLKDAPQSNNLTSITDSTPKYDTKENCVVDVHKRTTSFWWKKAVKKVQIDECGIMNNVSEFIVGKKIENANIVSCLTPYYKADTYYSRIYYFDGRMKYFASPCVFQKTSFEAPNTTCEC